MPRPPSRLRTSTVDDRGHRVGLAFERLGGPMGERRQRLLVASDGLPPRLTGRERRRAIGYGLVSLPAVLIGGVTPAWVSGTALPAWAKLLIILPTALIPLGVTLFVMRRVMAERLASQYLKAGYCATCGYDLIGIQRAADGCRVCPECGAAWRHVR